LQDIVVELYSKVAHPKVQEGTIDLGAKVEPCYIKVHAAAECFVAVLFKLIAADLYGYFCSSEVVTFHNTVK
jgi:hypothetical protein